MIFKKNVKSHFQFKIFYFYFYFELLTLRKSSVDVERSQMFNFIVSSRTIFISGKLC